MKTLIYKSTRMLPAILMLAACSSSRSTAMRQRPPQPEARASSDGDTAAPTNYYATNDMRQAGQSKEASTADERYAISLEQLRDHQKNHSAVIIDARNGDTFAQGHVRGAMNVPASKADKFIPQIQKDVPKDQFIIIYCASSTCGAGDIVYDRLAAAGYGNMRVFKPGWQRLSAEKSMQ